ncbi:MAG: ECF transporter S component [Candidatus Bathyarchaeia archaeon]
MVYPTAMPAKISRERQIAEVAIFSALSAVGAMIPIPSPVGSIALDSFPGYFMAIWRGSWSGATVCAVGHLLSAFRAGLPLGHIHLAVALLMAGVGILTAILKKRLGVIVGLTGGVALNTIGGVLAVPVYGWGFLPIITPFLLVASIVNAAVAGIIYKAFEKLKWS